MSLPPPGGATKLFSGRFSWGAILRDLPFAAVALAALVGVFSVPRLYHAVPLPFFPRIPADFRSPDVLEKERAAALAILEGDPANIEALLSLSLISFQEGPEKYTDCLDYAERALAAGALDHRLFYFTAVAYEAKALNDYAAEAYEKFLRHHPQDLETRLRLGNLRYRMGDSLKAADSFREVLSVRPGDPLVTFNLSVALRDHAQSLRDSGAASKEYEEGVSLLTALRDRDKTLPANGFRVLGDLFMGAKQPGPALDSYKKELERSPGDADLLAAAAQAQDDLGDVEAAIEAWKQVLAVEPRHSKASSRIRQLNRQKNARPARGRR